MTCDPGTGSITGGVRVPPHPTPTHTLAQQVNHHHLPAGHCGHGHVRRVPEKSKAEITSLLLPLKSPIRVMCCSHRSDVPCITPIVISALSLTTNNATTTTITLITTMRGSPEAGSAKTLPRAIMAQYGSPVKPLYHQHRPLKPPTPSPSPSTPFTQQLNPSGHIVIMIIVISDEQKEFSSTLSVLSEGRYCQRGLIAECWQPH